MKIINEPTAAAIAFGFKELKNNINKTIMVFDLGGGTFDISIMKVNGGDFDVIAVNGDCHLGGEDFDNRIIDYLVSEFKAETGHDLTGKKKQLRRLRTYVEKAKCILSETLETEIECDNLFEGEDLVYNLTRAHFEDSCKDLFKKTIELTEACLKDAKLSKSNIDEVVLVGGSTRIPKVKELLNEFMGCDKLNNTLHPDEAVALGATI